MKYPEETIAIGAKGRKEARVLESKGKDFVVYGYVDIASGKPLNKYSVLLRKEKGEIEHLFIIRLPKGKELVVKHETEKPLEKRGIYDKKNRKVFHF